MVKYEQRLTKLTFGDLDVTSPKVRQTVCEFIFSFSYLVEVTMVEVNEELQISRAKSLE